MINFVHIYFASQSGTAATLAEQLAELLESTGINSDVAELNQCDIANIPAGQPLIILCATTGDGDIPDNGAEFLHNLQDSSDNLSQLDFALLALGDSGFGNFCGAGRDINIELKRLGASAIIPRTDCDGPAEIFFNPWVEQLTLALKSLQAN